MENNLGYQIKKIREIKNISQDYVAKKLGISQAAYSIIESKTEIDESKLLQIATILEVEPEIIKNYNEKAIFNSCTQSGYINTNNINPIEKITELYEKLILEKDARIKQLEQLLNKM